MEELLTVRDLKKYFPVKKGFLRQSKDQVKAVDDVSFTLKKGETLGLVGESGCGKSTLGRTVLQLLKPTSGEVLFKGKNISDMSFSELRPYRKDIQMIFQDPYSSLNSRKTVKSILKEPFKIHRLFTEKEREEKVYEMLELVGLNRGFSDRYAHEFSGGQRQRIGIARALMLNPSLIIADEPVSALDVSVQAQVLNLMQDLQEKMQLTYLFIAHDLSVVKHFSTRVGVMYLGRIVELANKSSLYSSPMHPYTKALLSAVPVPKVGIKRERIILQGDVPSPQNPPAGCAFHTRCVSCMDICKVERPVLKETDNGHFVACHLYE
ncbi:peptide ABC transporter ATP-binding protein [Bacillus freudenreichii]|nr:peptide ABC transporter ATP-binding protein [Bacillus freudenreichii]